MKIWYHDTGMDGVVIMDFGSACVMITDIEEYDFRNTEISLFKNSVSAERMEDITNSFWNFVPTDQKDLFQKRLIRHILS